MEQYCIDRHNRLADIAQQLVGVGQRIEGRMTDPSYEIDPGLPTGSFDADIKDVEDALEQLKCCNMSELIKTETGYRWSDEKP